MHRLIALIAVCFVLTGIAPAVAEWDVDHLEELIPHAESNLERERYHAREGQLELLTLVDNPPVGPIRNCAEWEPTSGVMIRYPLGLPYSLLRDMDDQVILHVVVSAGNLTFAQNNLATNDVDMDQVEFLVQDNDSIWTRDYGPWFIFSGDGELGIVNHTYNRPWRPNDNQIPYYFGLQQGLPIYNHSMYHTGGNYMTDGAHISSSTMLVYNEAASENGMTRAEVDALMEEYYGVETYSVLNYIESGGIHHIDTWAKFLDEETVLVKDVWPTHHTYDALNQRAALLASLTASTGRPYRVHRVYCYDFGSGPASYTNSLILNDHIYVPFFGNAIYDEAALEAYRTAAPGYEVSGYYYNGFRSDDALHCRAKGMMDEGMLRVGHVPVLEDGVGPVTIEARIIAHSGQVITEAAVHYRHDEGAWQALPMSQIPTSVYQAEIPAPAQDGLCQYYVSVTDASGRTEGMPRSQPQAHYEFLHAAGISSAPDLQNLSGPRLVGNFPNPFNPSTTFRFSLAHEGEAELTVIDARGRLVRELVNGVYPAGDHDITWDGRDSRGRPVPSGVYFYRLRAAGLQYTRAATLVK